MNIPVVYEDDWLLALDKPSGLLVIPTPKKETRTLTSILNNDLIEKGVSYRLHPCHRLDRDTSGLILYAKGKSIQQKMMQEFSARRVKKIYYALVNGALAKERGRISLSIEGKSAVTDYKVIKRNALCTMVEVVPLTGRTNQIRIHFKSMGHPILGDTKFAFRRNFLVKVKRLCLHAGFLEFLHPITNKRVILKSALPRDISELLNR